MTDIGGAPSTEDDPKARIQRVLGALFSPDEQRSEVYAILDGARDERVYYMIHQHARAYACLFAGRIDPALAVAAPWVIPLDRDAPFTRDLLSRGWGNAWGIFAVSRAPLEDMRRHLRRFLMVSTERGPRLYFRFYDPRVLGPYLPTCAPHELSGFFGPIERFVFEGDSADTLVSARPNGDLLLAARSRV